MFPSNIPSAGRECLDRISKPFVVSSLRPIADAKVSRTAHWLDNPAHCLRRVRQVMREARDGRHATGPIECAIPCFVPSVPSVPSVREFGTVGTVGTEGWLPGFAPSIAMIFILRTPRGPERCPNSTATPTVRNMGAARRS